ncbi:tRNA pseudouridine(54/55) synthase Pus10 [Nitrosopumilus sp.]|uniref:tRNA pseudouridine(54/55) synthase Pus10 n=1 Tax=Nitrosopumilus sp. TaxID=2024843 RepID=UPI003D0CC07F
MTTYQKIIPVANEILKKYDLCDHCLGRLFSKQLYLSSNKLLGKKLKKNSKSAQRCYICKNLFENLNYFLSMMIDVASPYSYSSFGLGATIKPSIIDRDDTIRSRYKLKGIDGIKTDITKELGKSFSKKTKKKFDTLDPEVVFTVNLKDEFCEIRSKSLTLSGRYVKPIRGFLQKQKSCLNCSGKGCRICDFHGIQEYDSVEGEISQFLFKKLGGTTAKFTWIGGEDKSSLILGTGRPFFVKIQNPHKRNLRVKSVNLEHVQVNNFQIVTDSPKKPLKFNSLVEAKISTSSNIDSKLLRKLKNLTKKPIAIYEKSGKRSEKRVLSIKYKKSDDTSFTLFFKFEGGLPVKRFVTGNDVSPGISQILDVSCKCLEFDFHDVEVK